MIAQKAVAKKVIIGIVAATAAGGTAFGAGYYVQQRQQAKIESQQAAKSVKTTKTKRKETKNRTTDEIGSLCKVSGRYG